MRLYTFGNYYLSSIQQAVQSAHVVSELFVKYPNELHDMHSPDGKLYDWATHHKTLICLNGGNNEELRVLYFDKLCHIGTNLGLPYARFNEDEQSLGGIMTCCGIVVPAKIYDGAQVLRGQDGMQQLMVMATTLPEELELAQLLNQYGLAR
jgi:hypothetical protein